MGTLPLGMFDAAAGGEEAALPEDVSELLQAALLPVAEAVHAALGGVSPSPAANGQERSD